mmetsp:Transcript_13693/g.26494  ORF Transcript_13693/g.26494 Transcript_13693/m.26494 type:complete len:747 (-) Transcript_13693:123-2363(-)
MVEGGEEEFAARVRAVGLRGLEQALKMASDAAASVAEHQNSNSKNESDRRDSTDATQGYARQMGSKSQLVKAQLETSEKMASSEKLADRARKYLERRQARESQRKLEMEIKETEGLQQKPTINQRSQKLAQQRGRESNVGLALYADAEVQRVSREILTEEHYEGTMHARPAITRQAAELVREGNVADRLYQQARVKQAHQAASNQTHPPHSASAPSLHASSGSGASGASTTASVSAQKQNISSQRRLSTPAGLPVSQSKSSQDNAVDLAGANERSRARRASEMSHGTQALKHAEGLYMRALEAKQARERAVQMENEKFRKRANPKLGSKTKKIAAELGQSSKERLLNPSKEVQVRRQTRRGSVQEEDLTFKPRINPTSKKILRKQPGDTSLDEDPNAVKASPYDRLYAESNSRKARQASLEVKAQIEREQSEVQECTFKPHITPFEPLGDEHKSKQQDVVDRLKDWDTRRACRLEQERRAKEAANELGEEYTFAPKINRARRQSNVSVVSPKDTEKKKAPGVDAYIARQRRAREERERKEKAHENTTVKWTNRVTIPVAPKLGVASHRAANLDPSLIHSSNLPSESSNSQDQQDLSVPLNQTSVERQRRVSSIASRKSISGASRRNSEVDAEGMPRRAPPPRPPSLSPGLSDVGDMSTSSFSMPSPESLSGIRNPEEVLEQAKQQVAIATKMLKTRKAAQRKQDSLPPSAKMSVEQTNEGSVRRGKFDASASLDQFHVLKSLLQQQ